MLSRSDSIKTGSALALVMNDRAAGRPQPQSDVQADKIVRDHQGPPMQLLAMDERRAVGDTRVLRAEWRWTQADLANQIGV